MHAIAPCRNAWCFNCANPHGLQIPRMTGMPFSTKLLQSRARNCLTRRVPAHGVCSMQSLDLDKCLAGADGCGKLPQGAVLLAQGLGCLQVQPAPVVHYALRRPLCSLGGARCTRRRHPEILCQVPLIRASCSRSRRPGNDYQMLFCCGVVPRYDMLLLRSPNMQICLLNSGLPVRRKTHSNICVSVDR